MKIRNARLDDVSKCLKISKSDGDDYWSKTDFEVSVKNRDIVFLVAEDNSKVMGYVLGFVVPTKKDEALVHETRVLSAKRGSGVGTKLVNSLCERLFSKGVKTIYAEIENQHTPFYVESCGFEKSGNWIEVKRIK